MLSVFIQEADTSPTLTGKTSSKLQSFLGLTAGPWSSTRPARPGLADSQTWNIFFVQLYYFWFLKSFDYKLFVVNPLLVKIIRIWFIGSLPNRDRCLNVLYLKCHNEECYN